MARQSKTRYSIVVKDRPGELARLTKILSDRGIRLSDLRVSNIGDRAAIEFASAQDLSWMTPLLAAGRTSSRIRAS